MANDNSHPQVPHPSFDRSSSSSSASSQSDLNEAPHMMMHAPTPVRPGLPSRRSSGCMIVPRDSLEVGPIESRFGPDDVRAMSPRRTSKDIEEMGKEAREELKKHAQSLQQSLLTMLSRIEAVREEHDKLDNHNKFLQKYIGDLMSTSRITATGGRTKK